MLVRLPSSSAVQVGGRQVRFFCRLWFQGTTATAPSVVWIQAINARTCYRLAHALGGIYLQERERLSQRQTGQPPTHILLDLDGTDDPTHGEQEGSAYHGYYRQHMYHPLLIFDGTTDQLVTAVLRPGTVHASRGVVAVLKRVVRALRARWPHGRPP
jgi:Transposase DDE domain group 1